MGDLIKGDSIDFSKIHRILITKMRFHGDVLLSTPIFTTLKRLYPHLECDALIYKETTDMLSLHPSIDTIFTVDRTWKKKGTFTQIKEEKKLFSQLKNRQYDLIIHLTENWRSVLIKRLLKIPYAVCADFPRRQKNKFWQNSFTHIYAVPPNRSKVDSHLDALRQLGVNVTEQDRQLSLFTSSDDKNVVHKLFSQHKLSPNNYFHIHPTSRFFYKCWPPKVCAQFINALRSNDIEVVLTAAPSDKEREYVETLKKYLNESVIDLSGQLSLKQLAIVIDKSSCFIGVDSAPMHIASAMKTPTIALFGVTDAEIWGPVGPQTNVLKSSSDLTKPEIINGKRPNSLANCILDIDWKIVLEKSLRYL